MALGAPDGEMRRAGIAFVPLALLILPPVTRWVRTMVPPFRPPGIPTLAFLVLFVVVLGANAPRTEPAGDPFAVHDGREAAATVGPKTATTASVDIVFAGDVLRPAQDALNAREIDRAIKLFFAPPSTGERRAQPDAKRLLAAIQAASDKQIGRDQGSEFAYRVQTYWLTQIKEIPATGPVTDDQIRTGRVFLEEVVARELKSSRELPPSAELKKAQDQLAAAISAKQVAVFPRWRTFYGKQLGQTLWERNITVDVSGAGGRTIRFTGGLFASNANIAAFQQGTEGGLKMLRFNRTAYRWMPQADGWSYKLEVPSDADVGYWEGSEFVTAR